MQKGSELSFSGSGTTYEQGTLLTNNAPNKCLKQTANVLLFIFRGVWKDINKQSHATIRHKMMVCTDFRHLSADDISMPVRTRSTSWFPVPAEQQQGFRFTAGYCDIICVTGCSVQQCALMHWTEASLRRDWLQVRSHTLAVWPQGRKRENTATGKRASCVLLQETLEGRVP